MAREADHYTVDEVARILRMSPARVRQALRSGELGGERREEGLWMDSERQYRQVKRRQNVAAWFAHFCRMADNHRALCEHYEARAEALCEEGE